MAEYDITPEEQEDLEFVWLYAVDLDSAQHIYRMIQEKTRDDDRDKGLRYYLLLSLVVTYMRPFSTNRGKVRRRHSLDKKTVVPPDLESLHDRLENYRNQQFAHTDHEYRRPGIGNMGTVDKPAWGMTFRGSEFEFLDRNVQRIGALIKAVEEKVEAMREEKLAYTLSRVVRPPSPPPSGP